MKFFFLKFDFFLNENHPPTRQIKYKKIDFAPIILSIMAYKLSWTNMERLNLRLRVNSAKYIAR